MLQQVTNESIIFFQSSFLSFCGPFLSVNKEKQGASITIIIVNYNDKVL